MFKRPLTLAAVLVGAFLIHSLVLAQTPIPTPEVHKVPKLPKVSKSVKKRKAIVVKFTTVEGLRYYYAKEELKDFVSVDKLIRTLNDAEANRLLGVSKSSGDVGVPLLVGGIGVLVLGLSVIASDNNLQTGNGQIDSQVSAGIGVGLVGLVLEYVGAFELAQAETSKFAAVQRYNAVIRGEDETITWNINQPELKANFLAFNF